jgi:tetratricopeptide (TPR) repeat protein
MAAQNTRLIDSRWPLLALLWLTLAGCASLAPPGTPPAPRAPAPASAPDAARAPNAEVAPRSRPVPNSASASLLAQSRSEQAAGRYPQAAAAVERALGIEPNNPLLWLELGEIRLAEGNTTQAQAMARKALTLSAGDRGVEARAASLLRR